MSFGPGPDAEARIGVEVNDAAAIARLRELDASFDARMASLSRKEATIKIKGDASDLKRSVDEAKASLKQLEAEEVKEAALRDTLSNQAKAASTRRLNAIQAEKNAIASSLAEQQKQLAATDNYLKSLQRSNQQLDIAAQKQAAVTKAVDSRHQSYVQEASDLQRVATLQERQLAAQQKISDLEKAGQRAQGSDKQRVDLQTAGEIAKWEQMRRELEMMGQKPIVQKVDVKADTSVFDKLRNALLGTGGNSSPDSPASSNDGALTLMEKFRRTFSASMNVGPFNASVGSIILAMAPLAPAIMAVLGAAGSLVSVLGSGIAGAAGLGGAALTGFGMAAIGVKSALQNTMQQVTTIKAAINSYQTVQQRYGPRTTSTPAAQAASARIPGIQARISADQARVAAATANYGAGSPQVLNAQASLATAQGSLTSAQTRAAAGANRTQRAYVLLQNTLKNASPVVRDAANQWLNLSSTWQKLTQTTAQHSFGTVIDQLFKTANSNVKWYAKDTNETLKSFSAGWTGWMKMLRAPDVKLVLDNIFHNFNLSIRPAMDGIGHLADALLRFFSTMSNYEPFLAHAFDGWATGIDNASKATDGWASKAPFMIHSLESIGHFAAAAVKWVYELLRPAAGPGQNFLNDMANSLDRTSKSLSTVQKQKSLGQYFQESVTGVENLWKALSPIGTLFAHLATFFTPLAQAMLPVVDLFGKLATWATSASGPMGKILLDITAFILSARLVGQVTRLTSVFTAMGGSLSRVGGVLKALTIEGSFMDRVKAAGTAWSSAGANSGGIAKGLATGANDAGAVIAKYMVDAGAEAGAVMAREMAGGGVVGGLPGRTLGTVERTASGAIPLPGASTEAAVVAEQGGFLGRFKGVGGRLLKGAGIGLGVGLGSQMVGSMVGGHAGSVISNVGAGAGIGAGIGGMVPIPGGALIGAAIGAVGSAILTYLNTHTGPDFATRSGNRQAGMYQGTNVSPNDLSLYQHAFAHQARIGTNALQAYRQDTVRTVSGPHGGVATGSQAQATKDWNTWFDSMVKRGQLAGQEFVKMFGSVPFKSAPAFIIDAEQQLHNLRGAARTSAAETMVTYAAQLEKSGQLPKGSLKHIITALTKEFPSLEKAFQNTGEMSAKYWATEFQMNAARTSLKSSMEFVRAQFGMLNIDPNVTGKNWIKNMDTTVSDLHMLMKSKLPEVRDEATRVMRQMRMNVEKEAGSMTSNVVANAANMSTAIQNNVKGAGSQVSDNFLRLQQNVTDAMSNGLLSVKQGSKLIGQALNATLKAFGSKPLPLIQGLENMSAPPSHMRAMAGVATSSSGYAFKPPGAATGARIPGMPGPDNYTIVDSMGLPRARVGGGELVIANRHTEDRVDDMLSHFGTSLNDEINSETLVHTAAPRPVQRQRSYNPFLAVGGAMPYGQIESLWDQAGGPRAVDNIAAAIAMAESSGIVTNVQKGQPYSTTGWGLWQITPGNSEPQFGTNQALLTGINNARAAVAKYQGAGNSFSPWTTFMDGAYRTYLGGAHSNAGAIGNVPLLHAPRVFGGTETLNHMIVAGLGKETIAANSYLQAHAQSVSGGAGPGTMLAAPGSGTNKVEQAMFAGANQIMGRPYVYGGGHGGFSSVGYDCSGAVSYVLHSGGLIGSPMTTDGLKTWGEAGPGKYVTVGVRGSTGQNAHTMMSFFGKYLESGGGGPYAANKVHWDPGWDGSFTWYRHPKGFATGGTGDFGEVSPMALLGSDPTLANSPGFQMYAKAWKARKHAPGAATGMASSRRPSRPRSIHPTHARTAHRTTPRGVHSPPSLAAAMMEERYRKQELAARQAYENYNYSIHHKHHTPGHWVGIGKNRHWHAASGGPTTNELHHLHELKAKYNNLLKDDPHWSSNKAAERALSGVLAIPPQDRIGGIGTSDLDQAAADAQQMWQTAQQSLGKHPSAAARRNVSQLHRDFIDIRNVDNEAKSYVQQFSNMETVIGNLDNYMTDAAGNTDDMSMGYDPGMGNTPAFPKTESKRSWSHWRQVRQYWMDKHTKLLRAAAKGARAAMTKHGHKLNPYDSQYLHLLAGDISQSSSDAKANKAATDPAIAGGITIDQYIQSQGKTNELAKLNYQLSLDQGLIAANPGSQSDFNKELSDTKLEMDFYQSLLSGAQASPKTKNNFNLLQQLSDAFNTAQSNYLSLAAPTGPTQDQLASTAMSTMFRQYAGNVASLLPTGTVDASALATATVPANPAAATSNPGGTGSAGTSVSVVNNYQTMPTDPHSWSQGLAYELQAAI